MITKKFLFELVFLSFLTLLVLFFYRISSNTEESFQESSVNSPQDAIAPLCNGVNFEDYQNMSLLYLNNLNITIPNSQGWYKNLFEAYIDGGIDSPPSFIQDEYKNYFSGLVEVEYKDNIKCILKAEIRISGDWKDHIEIKNSLASLDVKLIQGNIDGITKFKLFLPDSRRNENELFATTVLESMGYLVPRTKLINVNFNETGLKDFIFQEKINKEFLEFNNLREAPIIETNEKYFWDTSSGQPFKEIGLQYTFLTTGKIKNINWASRSLQNQTISMKALGKYNRALNLTNLEGFLHQSLNNDYQIGKFEAIVTGLEASHMLVNHNRIFYYDRIEDRFMPIYYDGMPAIIDSKEFFIRENYFDFPSLILGANSVFNYLNINNIDSKIIYKRMKDKGSKLTEHEVDILLDKFLRNLEILSNQTIYLESSYPGFENLIQQLDTLNLKYETNEKWNVDPNARIQNTFDRGVRFLTLNSNNAVEECNQYLDICKEFENENSVNLFAIELQDNFQVYGISNDYIETDIFEVIETDLISLKTFNNPLLIINEENNLIEIELNSNNQKVLFSEGSNLENYTIEISSKLNELPEFRTDNNLLTGCVTFNKVFVTNLIITMNNSYCEDSINFIGSTGSISLINISNSAQDALDIDFSNLIIKELIISNSGNDCIDISSGDVTVLNLKTLNCSDKAVSVGEKSEVLIKNGEIANSQIGLATKDSSILKIENVHINDTEICYSIYRKKQEFGPAKISVKNLLCEFNDYFVQKGSIIESRK